jgi:hypothetical protein
MNIFKKSFVVIFFSVIIFSFVLYFSAKNFSEQGAYIETKGLSEKIVKSDTAIWSINFQVKSNNVDTMYSEIEKNILDIKTFLTEEGFDKKEISIAPLDIYQDTYGQARFRYNSTVRMSVYTEKVDLVKSTSEKIRALIKKGIIMTNNYINFSFSDLNSIKSEMISESTRNAKKSAEDFAKNSGTEIGKLVRGRQGVFSITEKDPGSPEYKKVRVVSTLRFLLK